MAALVHRVGFMRTHSVLVAAALAAVLCGCPKDDEQQSLTAAEASDLVEESTTSSQASALTTSSVDISTTFTLGQGVQQAANEIRTFIQSQLACAEVTVAAATLTVTYGAKPGNCTYRGHTFSGSHAITVSKNVDGQVIVDHQWTDLSNGLVKVTGTAHVTWDFDDRFRTVAHDLTWTRLRDGRTGHGTGSHTLRPLGGRLEDGIEDDGAHAWEGRAGRWELLVQKVEWRWKDPVPQAGTYELTTPKKKKTTMSFARVDEDTIHVTVSHAGKTFGFDVNALGGATSKDES